MFYLYYQLDLVCDNNWLPSFSTTLFYVGSLFGNLLFGWIADKYENYFVNFVIYSVD